MNWLRKSAADFVRRLLLTDASGWQPGSESSTGEIITQSSVLGISAAWACVNLIAGTIATLPLMVYRTDTAGRRTVARDHPLYRILHDSPNADQTAVDFWEFQASAMELRGNSFARVVRSDAGRLIALQPVRPDIVAVRRLSSGEIEYSWTDQGKSYREPSARMFHVRGFGGDPLGGLSTLTYGREVFGLAQAMTRSAAAIFKNGIQSSGIYNTETKLSAPQVTEVETMLAQKYQGAMNAGRPMVLGHGLKWNALSMSPDDAQMLESRGLSIEEVCRFFGVPPFMIGHTEKSTSWGTGIEQQSLGFVKFTLRRRLKRIEMAIEKQLLTAADRAGGLSIEFNLEGLLRADSKARSAFYREMSGIGAMTINEIRALENLPPVEGGDVPRMQMQNVPITEAGGDINPTEN